MVKTYQWKNTLCRFTNGDFFQIFTNGLSPQEVSTSPSVATLCQALPRQWLDLSTIILSPMKFAECLYCTVSRLFLQRCHYQCVWSRDVTFSHKCHPKGVWSRDVTKVSSLVCLIKRCHIFLKSVIPSVSGLEMSQKCHPYGV